MSTTAFVFPGQGSQSIGMLASLAEAYPMVESLFSTVSERVGYDVWQLTQSGPESKLNETMYTQVVMLTADVAVYHVLQQAKAIDAVQMAGHSLGEYAALVCAGALSLPDAAALVAKRGQLMQETVPLGEGAMAAIVGLSDEQVVTICDQASTSKLQVMPANFNAIGQVVIAGHTAAVQRAIELAEQQNARMARLIPVSVPCHCMLLREAADTFAESLAQVAFQVPSVPVISNVDMQAYQSVEHIRTQLAAQLYKPVRWVETIQGMKSAGVQLIIECGPGKVLSGLVKRIDKSINVVHVNDPTSLENTLACL